MGRSVRAQPRRHNGGESQAGCADLNECQPRIRIARSHQNGCPPDQGNAHQAPTETDRPHQSLGLIVLLGARQQSAPSLERSSPRHPVPNDDLGAHRATQIRDARPPTGPARATHPEPRLTRHHDAWHIGERGTNTAAVCWGDAREKTDGAEGGWSREDRLGDRVPFSDRLYPQIVRWRWLLPNSSWALARLISANQASAGSDE
jgi:hypothetical protein